MFEGELLREANFSLRVIQTIVESFSARIYNNTWSAFCKWCCTAQVNPKGPSLPHILEFFWDGLEKGLSHNTLRRQVEALSTILVLDGREGLGHHPVIKRFLKGAANLKPPMVHRFPS